MQDELFESLTFESKEEIKERFKRPKEKIVEKIIEPEPPKLPELTPIWSAYWSIDTSTPEKFEKWLRLRPPYEDIYITNKINDVEQVSIPAFTGMGRRVR